MLQPITKDAWSAFLLDSAAAGAEFAPVVVKTLRSHYQEVIRNMACRKHEPLLRSAQPDIVKFERRVNETAERYERDHQIAVQPFIDVSIDAHVPMVVCLDIETISDDTWCLVLDTLSNIDFGVGKTVFGEAKCFGPNSETVKPSDILDNMRQSFV